MRDELGANARKHPIAVKDNFAIRGEIVSAGSKMLSKNECSYTATVIDRLEQSGAVVFGQTAMDESGRVEGEEKQINVFCKKMFTTMNSLSLPPSLSLFLSL